jgi:hypothetical protein
MPSSEKSEADIGSRLSRRVAGIAWWVRVYRQMFADNEDNAWCIPEPRREAFEAASAEFMFRLEILLREECALELCRLMDPKTTGGQENECLMQLLPFNGGESSQERIQKLKERLAEAKELLSAREEDEKRAGKELPDHVGEARQEVEKHSKELDAAHRFAQLEADMRPLRDWRNTAKAHSALADSALAKRKGVGGGPAWKDITQAWKSMCAFMNQLGGVAPGVKEGLQHQATILSEPSGTKIVNALARARDHRELEEKGVIPPSRASWALSENEAHRERVESDARNYGWWDDLEGHAKNDENEE